MSTTDDRNRKYRQLREELMRDIASGRVDDEIEAALDRAGDWLKAELPALHAADLIQAAIDARDPYMNDRPYPQPQDWTDGRNPFARPNPEAPWVKRGRPEPLDALEACPPRGVRCRRLAVLGNPERIA